MRRQLICLLLLLAPFAALGSETPVVVDFFYQHGCPECTRIRTKVLPDLADLYQGLYVINEYDTNVRSNVIRLIAYQQTLGISSNAPVTMIVDRTHALTGYDAIAANLQACVDRGIAERALPDWQPPPEIAIPENQDEALAMAGSRFRRFSLPVILLGGFLDGINPCAIGTLVFFMSLLAVSGITGRALIILGFAYCAATFVTYFAIGLGLLHALRQLDAFTPVKSAIHLGMAALLVVLAALSLLDAYRYRATSNANAVLLQLPLKLKKRIHRIMRRELSRKSILLAGLFTGTLVTVLESACTGQLYLPVLLMLARSEADSAARAWGYLLIYNAAFLVPLVSVFLLVYAGTVNTGGLLAWSRKNVVPAKLLLAGFFLLLAGILLFS